MRIALAGVGHWHAAMHADAVRHAGAEIISIWDPDPAVTARFAVAQSAAQAASLDALLATCPDLVVAMGHPTDTPALARAVLAAGLPMLLEKPAASDTASLIALAPHPSHFIAVPLPNRLSPIWPALTGTPIHAHFRIINGRPERYRADGVPWMLDPAIAGGGALRNLGLHALDAALTLFAGTTPTISGAHLRHTHPEHIETYAAATLSTPGGPVITIEAGYTIPTMQPGGDFEWRVVTTEAAAIDHGNSCTITTTQSSTPLTPLPPALRYRAFMADTLARLAIGRPPLVGFPDYVAAMHLADRIYAAAE
jgi:predicted dehydrogenase